MSRRIVTRTVPAPHQREVEAPQAIPPTITGPISPRPTRGSDVSLVITQVSNDSKTAKAPTPLLASPDDFLGRLVKYIPAELVGLYVAARGVIPKTAEPSVYWGVAAVTWVFVPVYFWFATTRSNQKPLTTQILLATIAFPIWVFAIGGDPVASWPWYATHQYLASLSLMFATVAFGLVQPPPGT